MDTLLLQDTIKEVVDGEVRPMFQTSMIMFNEVLAKEGEKVNVKGTRLPIEVEISEAGGWHGEGAGLPEAGEDIDVAFRVGYTRYTKPYEFTEDFMKQSESDESLLKGVSARFARYLRDVKVEFSQMMYGTGNGCKGVVASVTSTGANGVAVFQTNASWTYGARMLTRRLKLQFYSASNAPRNSSAGAGVAATTCKVTAIVHSTATVTFDTLPTDLAATDFCVRKGSLNKAIRGFGYHVPSAPGLQYQGVDTSLYTINPTVVDAGGAPLTFALMHKVKHGAAYKLNDESKPYIVTAPTQFDAAEMLGHNMRRYTSQEATLNSGFSKVKTDGREWVKDPHCPEDTIFYLDLSRFRKLELKSLGPKRVGGMELFPKTTTEAGTSGYADIVIGYLQWSGDIAGEDPRCQGKVYNLGLTGLTRGYLNM